MSAKTNNPNSFWQELKRRKVIRVIIGYLAAAYVILEAVTAIPKNKTKSSEADWIYVNNS